MMLIRSHEIHRRHGDGRSGSVIVLVVAVLALLAVIGTVYIVSARAQRASATASSVGVNLDLAQQAVNERVADRIGSDMYDATGTVGGYQSLGTFGSTMARSWDMPEFGLKGLLNSPPVPNLSDTNSTMRDQSWLASGIYRPANILLNPFLPTISTYNDISFLTLGGYNPAKGIYDTTNLAYITNGAGLQLNPNLGLFNVVNSDFSGITIPDYNASAGPDAVINLLPFSEESGIRYRYGVRIVDTSGMANLNVGMPYDPVAGGAPATFPFFEMSGTLMSGYNLMASSLGVVYASVDADNLQTARIGVAPTTPGAPSTTLLWTEAAMRADSRNPRTNIPFGLGDELELRAYGIVGSNVPNRPALTDPVWEKALLGPNLGSSIGLTGAAFSRNYYTTYSQARDLRTLPPNDVTTAGQQMNTIAYTLTGNLTYPSATVWPLYPARIAASPIVDGLQAIPQSDRIAAAATNIATAMEIVPLAAGLTVSPTTGSPVYSHQEACSFAANYITNFSNTWTGKSVPSLTGGANVIAYQLANGPSFVDQRGICTRTINTFNQFYNGNYGSNAATDSDLNSQTAGVVYLGYAAQPFLNEAVLQYHIDAATGAVTFDDSAIELYNPYNVALSLDDYKLQIDATTSIDLTNKGYYVPARGYFVITQVAGVLAAKVTNVSAVKVVDATGKLALHGASGVYLMRRYVDRTGNAAFGAVDQYNVQAIGAFNPTVAGSPPFDPTPHTVSLSRDNADSNTANLTLPDRWVATVATPKSISPGLADQITLGGPNPNTAEITAANGFLVLRDANIDAIGTNGIAAQVGHVIQVHSVTLNNVADFNRVMRVTDEINATGATPGLPYTGANSLGALPVKLASIYTNAPDTPVANSTFKLDAMVHFDFQPPAGMYSVSGIPTGPNAPAAGDGDQRAVRLLDSLAFVDRFSDPSISVVDTTGTGLPKLRLPGRININTASPEVLLSIPILDSTPITGVTKHPELVTAILAYRWRTKSTDSRIPLPLQSLATVDFSDQTKYPGYGFRSLSELLAVISTTLASESGYVTTNLDDRDAIWADVYNYFTVRSDTFAVYAYLEAVKQNPRYQGAFDNSTMWYGNDFTSTNPNITDDPSDPKIAGIPLLRVARRRWVAIIDRSQVNYNINDFRVAGVYPPPPSKPSIVAQRDLPQ